MGVMIQPRSRFLKVECPKCKNKQVVFDRSAIKVKCNNCGEVLVIPTGSKADVKAKVLQVLG